MQVEIISTGDEVITGFINDTNATWLSQQLLSLGIQVHYRHTCGDELEDIRNTIEQSSKNADLVFINGGLGPTTDDITAQAAALAANQPLKRHPEWVEKMREWHKKRNRPMCDANLKQADIPQKAFVIDNPNGTACGFYLTINRATCFFTPGVPHEFKAMFNDSIKPYILNHFKEVQETKIKRFFLFGIGESSLQEHVNKISLPSKIVIGYRAAYPVLELKVISHGVAEEMYKEACEDIRHLISPQLLCEDQLDVPKLIASKIGKTTVNICDCVTKGQLSLDLSSDLNVGYALILADDKPEDVQHFTALAKGQGYELILRSSEENEFFLKIKNAKHNVHHSYKIKLSLTVKGKINEALSLCSQMLFKTIVFDQPLPKLEIAGIEEITNNNR